MPIKNKPQNFVPFKHNKRCALFYDGDRELFVLAFGYSAHSDTQYICREEKTFMQPNEAITIFEDTYTQGLRREYGTWLEGLGYLRHSGVKASVMEKTRPVGAKCGNCVYGVGGADTCPERYRKGQCINGIPLQKER